MNSSEGYSNRQDLVEYIARKNGMSKRQADKVVGSAVEFIENTLARGEKFRLVNFGVFMPRHRGVIRAMNINTQQVVEVPAHSTVHFKPSKWLRTIVNR